MVRLEDKSILEKDVQDGFHNPLLQKVCDDRTIYRNNYGQPTSITGMVSITDFGHSTEGDGPHNGCIQAEPYRAQEVILDACWSYSSDIWRLGVMVCFPAALVLYPTPDNSCSYGIYWKIDRFLRLLIHFFSSTTSKLISHIYPFS